MSKRTIIAFIELYGYEFANLGQFIFMADLSFVKYLFKLYLVHDKFMKSSSDVNFPTWSSLPFGIYFGDVTHGRRKIVLEIYRANRYGLMDLSLDRDTNLSCPAMVIPNICRVLSFSPNSTCRLVKPNLIPCIFFILFYPKYTLKVFPVIGTKKGITDRRNYCFFSSSPTFNNFIK